MRFAPLRSAPLSSPAEVRLAQVRLDEVRPAEVRLAEIRLAEIRLDEVCPAELRTAESTRRSLFCVRQSFQTATPWRIRARSSSLAISGFRLLADDDVVARWHRRRLAMKGAVSPRPRTAPVSGIALAGQIAAPGDGVVGWGGQGATAGLRADGHPGATPTARRAGPISPPLPRYPSKFGTRRVGPSNGRTRARGRAVVGGGPVPSYCLGNITSWVRDRWSFRKLPVNLGARSDQRPAWLGGATR